MIKILAACGAGVNSSHQIKSALEEELSNRGYDVQCDAVMVKDVNEDLIKGYDIFTPIAATDLGFEPGIPVVEAGPILFRIPAMSAPVYDNIEAAIEEHGLSSLLICKYSIKIKGGKLWISLSIWPTISLNLSWLWVAQSSC